MVVAVDIPPPSLHHHMIDGPARCPWQVAPLMNSIAANAVQVGPMYQAGAASAVSVAPHELLRE